MALLAMLVSAATLFLLDIMRLPLLLLSLESSKLTLALDHPGMVILALIFRYGRVFFANLSVGPVDTFMTVILTPTLCLTLL